MRELLAQANALHLAARQKLLSLKTKWVWMRRKSALYLKQGRRGRRPEIRDDIIGGKLVIHRNKVSLLNMALVRNIEDQQAKGRERASR